MIASMIDLRSDTVTQPTPDMREAMARAEVGDDVYGDDPTVRALEARTADLLGKDDAVYMPTGTMTNQVALRAHTEAGDEILAESSAHIFVNEGGAPEADGFGGNQNAFGIKPMQNIVEAFAFLPGASSFNAGIQS